MTEARNSVKLAGGLPQGAANGLRDQADPFLDDPQGKKLAIVVLDTKGDTTDYDKGAVTAVVRVTHIEMVTDVKDVKELRRLMMRANERRTGQTVLPLDLEGDIDEIFAKFTTKVDKETGEVTEE